MRAALTHIGTMLAVGLAARGEELLAQTHAATHAPAHSQLPWGHGARAGSDSATSAFAAAARAGTARYRELAVAIAEGYRRVGGDLPSLGEHWVHLGRIAAGRMTPAEPPVLIYTRVQGEPRLVGVAFVAHLRPSEPYPDYPAGPGVWHDHNGSVDQEVLPLSHAAAPSGGAAGTRLAVMHAWLWAENPRGLWTADNWALPFVRLGVRYDSASVPAAAALALASGSAEYYARAAADIGRLDDQQAARARVEVERAAAEVETLAAAARSRGYLTSAELARLEEVWTAMWENIAIAVGPAAAARLRAVREVWRD